LAGRPLAIVTGASRGIGRTLAIRMAREGYVVACLARSKVDLDALAAEHEHLHAVVADVTDAEGLEAAIDGVLDAHGPCVVLVNNAGYGLRAAVEEIPLDQFRRQMEVNVFSCVRLIQKVLPGMRAARNGCIVNVSSVAGRIATPFSGAYCATKFGLEALSDALRLEVKSLGIRVILIEPGPVKTNFVTAAAEVSDDILENPSSPYSKGYAGMLAQLNQMHSGAWTTEAVVDVTMRAIQSPNPKARYGTHDWLLTLAINLRKFSPGLLDYMLMRRMGL